MATPKKPREEWEKQGRPPVYNEKLKTIIKNLALQQKTDTQICETLEISRQTFYRWIKEDPDLSDKLIWARKNAIGEVVAKLYEKATGASVKEEKVLHTVDEEGNIIHEVVTINKNFPPDVAAIKFLLINRDPENWKEKHESAVTVRNMSEDTEKNLTGILEQARQEMPEDDNGSSVEGE